MIQERPQSDQRSQAKHNSDQDNQLIESILKEENVADQDNSSYQVEIKNHSKKQRENPISCEQKLTYRSKSYNFSDVIRNKEKHELNQLTLDCKQIDRKSDSSQEENIDFILTKQL